jgi:molecular chaperone GrpE
MTTPHDKKDRRSQGKRGDHEAGDARKGAADQPSDAADVKPASSSADRIVSVEPEGGAQPVTELHAAANDELRAALAERDQYLDHLQRLKAEFENYRKRVQRDNQALVLRAGEGVLESLLPVLDNMQRALESAQRHEEGQLIKGVEIVSGQLRSVLEGHGLDQVPAEPGLPFDPNIHEAVVAQESDEFDEGAIVAVLEPGYLLHGRLLRPARVVVAR